MGWIGRADASTGYSFFRWTQRGYSHEGGGSFRSDADAMTAAQQLADRLGAASPDDQSGHLHVLREDGTFVGTSFAGSSGGVPEQAPETQLQAAGG